MLGLIKKDIIMIKSNFKVLGIIFAVYIFMAIQGETDLSFILPFMGVMTMLSTFSYDEFNKWNAYACTLPNGRENIVKSKYISTLIIVVVTTFIVVLSSFFIMYFKTKVINYEEIFSIMFGVLFSIILIQSIMFPAIYKFGIEKARIGVFIIVFGIAFIGGLLSSVYDFSQIVIFLKPFENYMIMIIPMLMLVMLYISYKISKKINLKKDF